MVSLRFGMCWWRISNIETPCFAWGLLKCHQPSKDVFFFNREWSLVDNPWYIIYRWWFHSTYFFSIFSSRKHGRNDPIWRVLKLTWKINMEPKNHPIEEENHHPNHYFFASMLIFKDLVMVRKSYNQAIDPVTGDLEILVKSFWFVDLHQKRISVSQRIITRDPRSKIVSLAGTTILPRISHPAPSRNSRPSQKLINDWFPSIRPAIEPWFLRGYIPRNLQQDPLNGPLNLSI